MVGFPLWRIPLATMCMIDRCNGNYSITTATTSVESTPAELFLNNYFRMIVAVKPDAGAKAYYN